MFDLKQSCGASVNNSTRICYQFGIKVAPLIFTGGKRICNSSSFAFHTSVL